MHRSLLLAAVVPFVLASCDHATPTETSPDPVFNTTTSSTTLPGKIVVNHDEWTLGDPGFPPTADGDAFALSIASWFTGGGTGTFLVYSNDQFFDPNQSGGLLEQTMIDAGHGWTVSTADPPNATAWLATYDGVFLAGPAVPDNQVLIDYVEGGGSVYLAGGTGDFGGAEYEAGAWNTFLNHFNLDYEGNFPPDPWGTDYNGVGCWSLPVSSLHPIFSGVASLYHCNGNSVSELDPADPNTDILEFYGSHGLIGVYDGAVLSVEIDIKPGSYPNCFNNNGHGVIPVAILGGWNFDVSEIDAATVTLAGMSVAARGKSNKLLAHIEDVNGDGYEDLVVQIEDQDGVFTSGSTTGIVTGTLYSGRAFEGSDELCIVPPPPDTDGDGVGDDIDCDPTVANANTYEGHTYMVCQGQKNFADANTACSDAGFDLAYIDTEAENTWVVDFAISLYGTDPWPGEQTTYWIANRKTDPPQTTWPSGSPIWAAGEPTGDGTYIHLIRYYLQPYKWNDVPDSWTWGWVCESP